MSSEWPTVTLKEAGITLIDCDHKTPKAQETGRPYVGIPQLKDGRITLDGARLISDEDFHLWRRKAVPKPNDVILSRRCNPGESAYVPEDLEIALGQNLVLLRTDGKKVYPPFLRWLTQGPQWWEQVNKFINVGAVFDSLKCADIPNFQIRLPSYESQIQIEGILGRLDDKIELNRQINQTLEQIAQAIFKSWFVDFEPVKAKAAVRAAPENQHLSEQALEAAMNRAAMRAISGLSDEQIDELERANATSAESAGAADQRQKDPAQGHKNNTADTPAATTYQQLAATAALFPREIEESELGEIPKGWGLGSISSIAEVIMGQSPKGETYNDVGNGTALVNGPVEFGIYHPMKIKWTTSPTKLAKSGDLIACVRGSTTGRYVKSDGEYCLGRGVCAIRSVEYQPFVDELYKRELSNLLGLATGSTFPSWSGPTLKNYKIVIPDKSILKVFSDLTKPVLRKKSRNAFESESLRETREVLLPKLLSGELKLGQNQSTKDAVA